MRVPVVGVPGGELELNASCACGLPQKLAWVTGVVVPGVRALVNGFTLFGRRASLAARRSKLVVPSALVEPERAEHTMARRCWFKCSLRVLRSETHSDHCKI